MPGCGADWLRVRCFDVGHPASHVSSGRASLRTSVTCITPLGLHNGGVLRFCGPVAACLLWLGAMVLSGWFHACVSLLADASNCGRKCCVQPVNRACRLRWVSVPCSFRACSWNGCSSLICRHGCCEQRR
jgi:hypothetical protein